MVDSSPSGNPQPEPTEDQIEALARVLHDFTETNYVNKGMRLKWENPIVNQEGYRDEARAVAAAGWRPA